MLTNLFLITEALFYFWVTLIPTIYTEPMETVETDLPRRLTLAVY